MSQNRPNNSDEAWREVETRVNNIFKRITLSLEEKMYSNNFDYPSNIFFHALTGIKGTSLSKLERSTVTILGYYSKDLFRPFLKVMKPLPAPWTSYIESKYTDFKSIVKIIQIKDTINSTLKGRILQSYREMKKRETNTKFYILTISGERFPPIDLEGIQWVDPVETWFLVTGERNGYWRFKDIVFRVGYYYRPKFNSILNRVIEDKIRKYEKRRENNPSFYKSN